MDKRIEHLDISTLNWFNGESNALEESTASCEDRRDSQLLLKSFFFRGECDSSLQEISSYDYLIRWCSLSMDWDENHLPLHSRIPHVHTSDEASLKYIEERADRKHRNRQERLNFVHYFLKYKAEEDPTPFGRHNSRLFWYTKNLLKYQSSLQERYDRMPDRRNRGLWRKHRLMKRALFPPKSLP